MSSVTAALNGIANSGMAGEARKRQRAELADFMQTIDETTRLEIAAEALSAGAMTTQTLARAIGLALERADLIICKQPGHKLQSGEARAHRYEAQMRQIFEEAIGHYAASRARWGLASGAEDTAGICRECEEL